MSGLEALHPAVLASLGAAGASAAVVRARPRAPWLDAAIAAGAATSAPAPVWPEAVVGVRTQRLAGRVEVADPEALVAALVAASASESEARAVAAGAAHVHVHVSLAGAGATICADPYTDEHGVTHGTPNVADAMHQSQAQRAAAHALLYLPLLPALGCTTPHAQLVLCGQSVRTVTMLYESAVAALGVFNARMLVRTGDASDEADAAYRIGAALALDSLVDITRNAWGAFADATSAQLADGGAPALLYALLAYSYAVTDAVWRVAMRAHAWLDVGAPPDTRYARLSVPLVLRPETDYSEAERAAAAARAAAMAAHYAAITAVDEPAPARWRVGEATYACDTRLAGVPELAMLLEAHASDGSAVPALAPRALTLRDLHALFIMGRDTARTGGASAWRAALDTYGGLPDPVAADPVAADPVAADPAPEAQLVDSARETASAV